MPTPSDREHFDLVSAVIPVTLTAQPVNTLVAFMVADTPYDAFDDAFERAAHGDFDDKYVRDLIADAQ